MEIFKDTSGKISSKRIMGFVLFLVIIVMVLVEQIIGKAMNFQVFVSLLAAASGLIGLTAFERK